MKYLLKEKSDYNDEFNIEGFRIIEAESISEVKELITRDKEFPYRVFFGTNEWINYETDKDILDSIEIIEITEEEFGTFKKLFGSEFITHPRFGVTALLSDF